MTDTSLASQITQAELAILKGPLLSFAQALQAPGANILTVQNAGAALLAAVPVNNIALQAAGLNIVGAALAAKINSIGTPSA